MMEHVADGEPLRILRDLRKILALELDALDTRLSKLGFRLSLDAKAIDFIVDKGYDSALGARPLRRVVQQHVEDPIADMLLAGKAPAMIRGRMARDGKSIVFGEGRSKRQTEKEV